MLGAHTAVHLAKQSSGLGGISCCSCSDYAMPCLRAEMRDDLALTCGGLRDAVP
jgi:hypothetical protein